MINLGDKARDKMTGFTGIVVAVTDWLHNCRRYTLQPQDLKDGAPRETQTFDEPQVELVEAGAFAIKRDTGGPRPKPARARDPARS